MRRPAIFLPEWPGDGNCDSYLRLGADQSGYAFVFNANSKGAEAAIPLDERTGLDESKAYRIALAFPERASKPYAVPSTAKGAIRLTIPPRSVYLLALKPEAEE